LAAWQSGNFTIVEIGQDIGWIEAIGFVIDFANHAGNHIVPMLNHRFGWDIGRVNSLLTEGCNACRAGQRQPAVFEKVSSGYRFHVVSILINLY